MTYNFYIQHRTFILCQLLAIFKGFVEYHPFKQIAYFDFLLNSTTQIECVFSTLQVFGFLFLITMCLGSE